jgi:hypothetical protein
MSFKRPCSDLSGSTLNRTPRPSKRARLSPAKESDANSSDLSACSVSEASALNSTPPISQHTRNSSIDSLSLSLDTNDDSEDSLSTSDSSSESSDDEDMRDAEDEQDEAITTIGAPKKPAMRSLSPTQRGRDLRARLASLLPKMAEANEQLKTGGLGASMEDVEDGEGHIEMHLGLGVLEEKQDDTSSESESSEDGDAEDEKEEDVMGMLMGRGKSDGGVGIEPIT